MDQHSEGKIKYVHRPKFAMGHQMLLLECTNRWLLTFLTDLKILGHLPECQHTSGVWEAPAFYLHVYSQQR